MLVTPRIVEAAECELLEELRTVLWEVARQIAGGVTRFATSISPSNTQIIPQNKVGGRTLPELGLPCQKLSSMVMQLVARC